VSERLYRFVCADNCESLSYEIAEYLMNSDLVVRAEEDGRVLIHRGLRARHRAELAYELTHGGPPPETHQIALPPEAVARARKVPTSTRLYRFIFDGRVGELDPFIVDLVEEYLMPGVREVRRGNDRVIFHHRIDPADAIDYLAQLHRSRVLPPVCNYGVGNYRVIAPPGTVVRTSDGVGTEEIPTRSEPYRFVFDVRPGKSDLFTRDLVEYIQVRALVEREVRRGNDQVIFHRRIDPVDALEYLAQLHSYRS